MHLTFDIFHPYQYTFSNYEIKYQTELLQLWIRETLYPRN